MGASRMFAAMLLAAICVAPALASFDEPCWLISGPIDNCKAEEARRKLAEAAGRAKAEFIHALADAREKFWATYPNKPGALEAREKFADLLWQKDIYFLELALRYPQPKDLTDRRGPGFSMYLQDQMVGLLKTDGGIRQSASPEFFEWVGAVSKGFGSAPKNFDETALQSFRIAFMGETFWKSVAASQKEYRAYAIERDWWEFDDVKRIPAGFDAPETYGAYLYHRFAKVPTKAALENYNKMAELLGKNIVYAAAKQVMAAPKDAQGGLVVTAAPPVKFGPGGSQLPDYDKPMPTPVIGTWGSPIAAMEILATQGDDRGYLLYLLTDRNRPTIHTWDRATEWQFADKTYKRLVLAFGEPDVLKASHRVRTATKRMTSNTVMDPTAIGATRNHPFEAFQDILARTNPRGYVRSLLTFQNDLNSPAEVDAAYNKLVAASSQAAVLQAATKLASGKPQLIVKYDLENLKNELNGTSTMAEEPAEPEVDFPLYLAWKPFPAGARATYIYRGLRAARPGSDQLSPGQVSVRQTYALRSISNDRADLWLTEIVYDYPTGAAHSPRDTEIAYPAKAPQAPSRGTRAVPLQSGQETLQMGGKQVATHWQSVRFVASQCGGMVQTTWTSEQVPGGLVRKTEEENCSGTRMVRETLLESFDPGHGGSISTSGSQSQTPLPIPSLPASKVAPSNAAVKDAPAHPAVKGPPSSPPVAGAANGLGGQPPPINQRAIPVTSTVSPTAIPAPLTSPQPVAVTLPEASAQSTFVVPAGTVLTVLLNRAVNSSVDRPGDICIAVLDEPLVINGKQAAMRGTPVAVQLSQIPGGNGLRLALINIIVGGRKRDLVTGQVAVLKPPPGASATQILVTGTKIKVPARTRLAFTLGAPLLL